jgi:hypothetical protein
LRGRRRYDINMVLLKSASTPAVEEAHNSV